MRNTLLLSLAAFGLAVGTVQAGTLSADVGYEQFSGDLANVQIDADQVQDMMYFFGDLLVLTTEDGVTTVSINDEDEGLMPVGTVTVEINGTVATITLTDLNSGATCIVTYSDASEMPDVTTLEGLFTMLAQLSAIEQNS